MGYWDRICAIQQRQTDKGISTYGRPLEQDVMSVEDRITAIEEELIDALMYLEHLRSGMAYTIRQQTKEISIEQLDLSVRAYNVLRRNYITTVSQAMALTDDDLKKMRNCGAGTIREIREKISKYMEEHR